MISSRICNIFKIHYLFLILSVVSTYYFVILNLSEKSTEGVINFLDSFFGCKRFLYIRLKFLELLATNTSNGMLRFDKFIKSLITIYALHPTVSLRLSFQSYFNSFMIRMISILYIPVLDSYIQTEVKI